MRTVLLVLLVALIGGLFLVFGRGGVQSGDTALAQPEVEAPAPRASAELEQATESQRPDTARERVAEANEQAAEPRALDEDQAIVDLGLVRACAADLVDYNGRPVAERDVELAVEDNDRPGDFHYPALRARTDGKGRALFALPPEMDHPAPASVRLRDPERWASGWVHGVTFLDEGTTELGTVTLSEPRELFPVPLVTGWVHDGSGEPVSGVQGTVHPTWFQIDGEDHGGGWPPREEGQVHIEPDGSFQAFGPRSPQGVSLVFYAPGYDEHHDFQLETPTFDHEVVLARRIRLTGRLFVPENGPPVERYGVWLSQEGKGIGISPREDGRFDAIGSTHSLRVGIAGPNMGFTLYSEDFAAPPTDDGSLGDIDVRPLTRVLDLLLVDDQGDPLAEYGLQVSLEAPEHQSKSVRSDEQGRLLVPLPVQALEATILVPGEPQRTIDLVSPPARLELPRPTSH